MTGSARASDELESPPRDRQARDLEQLAHALSHDLRPALHQIKSFAELIASDPSSQISAKSARQLTLIREVSERTRQRLDALREFLTLGEPQEPTRVPAQELVADALQQLATLVAERSAQLQIGPLPELMGARPRLALLFRHLLDNALRYASAQGARVSVQAELRDARAWFQISDNGPGIAPAQRERACGLFQRLHAGEPAGLGVGLALCRRIVEQSAGELTLGASADGGTRVSFSLPTPD
jgi:light-regulated signal transduction histidine kinase (bacteriophytochrome)